MRSIQVNVYYFDEQGMTVSDTMIKCPVETGGQQAFNKVAMECADAVRRATASGGTVDAG